MEFTQKEKDIVRNLIRNEPSETSLLFFSNNNINLINKKIKLCILNETKQKYGEALLIENQKKTSMLVIMRYIYLEYSKYNSILVLPSPVQRVNELNEQFLRIAIPTVLQSLVSYIKYKDDFNKMGNSDLLERPESTRSTNDGTKEINYF